MTRHYLRFHRGKENDAADRDDEDKSDGDQEGEASTIAEQAHVDDDGADKGEANQSMGRTTEDQPYVDEDDEDGDGDDDDGDDEDGDDEDEGITIEDQPEDDNDREPHRTTTANTIIVRRKPQLNEIVSIFQGDKDKLAAYRTQAGPTAPYGAETINGYISWLPRPQNTFVFPPHVLEDNTDTPVPADAHIDYLVFPLGNGEDWSGGVVDLTQDKMPVIAFLDSNDLNEHVEDVPKIYRYLKKSGFLRHGSYSVIEPQGLPRQKNSHDSGVFFLEFLERFLQDPRLFFEKIGKSERLGWVVADDARSKIFGILSNPLFDRLAEKTREDVVGWAFKSCETLVGSENAADFRNILRDKFGPAKTTTEIVTASSINMTGEDCQDFSAGLPISPSDVLSQPGPQPGCNIATLLSIGAQGSGVGTNMVGSPGASPSSHEPSLVTCQTGSRAASTLSDRPFSQMSTSMSEGDNQTDSNILPNAKRRRLDPSQGAPPAQNSIDARSATGHQNNANKAPLQCGVPVVSPQVEAQEDSAEPSIQNLRNALGDAPLPLLPLGYGSAWPANSSTPAFPYMTHDGIQYEVSSGSADFNNGQMTELCKDTIAFLLRTSENPYCYEPHHITGALLCRSGQIAVAIPRDLNGSFAFAIAGAAIPTEKQSSVCNVVYDSNCVCFYTLPSQLGFIIFDELPSSPDPLQTLINYL